ncbi:MULTISPECIES: Cys-tRNA(Pro) deacylase [Halomonadaceae]|uniref:Cys-tRNA(Pro) deacylase n=1 Tax=Halomonadaceae TaxID=28256 RepID=UPI0015827C09|nr:MULTISPECIES: Cys-tRNA(Pro) deacylase [Halomonas]MDI4637361.1 Cys-tRNA(Pro) deacylase [Halomonas sp. BMC7]NUJ58529.1 Cys-tRNA(Pro) deacylase [Halomonas taeanensis]
MTPAVRTLKASGIDFQLTEYAHDPRAEAFGEEAAKTLGLASQTVFKTLLAKLNDGRLVVALVPVSARLDLKALARAAGARKATLAEPSLAERTTGYVVGGISPLGQKKRLSTFLDESALALPTLHVSGGRRGLEISLAPNDLVTLTGAQPVPLTRT